MIGKLSERIACYFVKNGFADASELDVYRFGIKVFFCDCVDILIALSVGLVMGKLKEAVCYFIAFVLLRRTVNGYHANTFAACKLMMTAMMLIVLLLSDWIVLKDWRLFFGIFTGLALFCFICRFRVNKYLVFVGCFTVSAVLMLYEGSLALMVMVAYAVAMLSSKFDNTQKTE